MLSGGGRRVVESGVGIELRSLGRRLPLPLLSPGSNSRGLPVFEQVGVLSVEVLDKLVGLFIDLPVEQEIALAATGAPMYAISPSVYTGAIPFEDEDASRFDEFVSLVCGNSAWYRGDSVSNGQFNQEECVLVGFHVAFEGRLNGQVFVVISPAAVAVFT